MKLLLIPYCFLVLLFFPSCSSSEINESNLKGSIIMTGNEPFTNLALKVNENEIYLLKVENKEQEIELRANQGKYYIISFDSVKYYTPGDTLRVKTISPAN